MSVRGDQIGVDVANALGELVMPAPTGNVAADLLALKRAVWKAICNALVLDFDPAWIDITVDPTAGVGVDKPIRTVAWQNNTSTPSLPIAVWIKDGSAATAWSQLWPNGGGGGGYVTACDIDYTAGLMLRDLTDGITTIHGVTHRVYNSANAHTLAISALGLVIQSKYDLSPSLQQFPSVGIPLSGLLPFSTKQVDDIWLWYHFNLTQNYDAYGGVYSTRTLGSVGYMGGSVFGVETDPHVTTNYARTALVDNNYFRNPSAGDSLFRVAYSEVNGSVVTAGSGADNEQSTTPNRDMVFAVRLLNGTQVELYSGVWAGDWPSRQSLTCQGVSILGGSTPVLWRKGLVGANSLFTALAGLFSLHAPADINSSYAQGVLKRLRCDYSVVGGGGGVGGGPATTITETSGPTTLTVGAVADGQYLKRVGATVVGETPGGAGSTPTGTGWRHVTAGVEDGVASTPAVSDITGAVATSDSRLTDARTPTAHASTHGAAGSDPVTVTEAQVTGLIADLSTIASSASAAQSTANAAGTLAATKLNASDPSVTNARTPTAHASSHLIGGGDALPAASTGTAGLVKLGTTAGTAFDGAAGAAAASDATTALSEIAAIALGGTLSQWNHPIAFGGPDTNPYATPKAGRAVKLDTNIFVGAVAYTLNVVAQVANNGTTGYVYLYNMTDGEIVGTPIAVTSYGGPVLQTFVYTVGTAAGNLKSTAGGKLYEARFYIAAPGAGDLISVGSIELVVS